MRKRDLSGEERALWSLVTRDVKPATKKRRPRAPDTSHQLSEAPPSPAPSLARGRRNAGAPAAAGESKKAKAPRRQRPPPALGAGDPAADRRAAKGLMAIERTVDLHGLTEAAAQARVSRFILGAQNDGVRLVLVITGKGAARGGEGRGVIRRRFVDWVDSAPLRAAIARVSQAKPKDGGDGAFYVFLKRKTRG